METHNHQSDFKSSVVVFLGTDCPISQYYAPLISQLESEFDLNFYSVFSDSSDTSEAIKAFTEKYKVGSQIITDTDQALTERFDARITPEVFLLDSLGQVIYSGKIDDRYYALGRHKYHTQQHYLKNAIESYLSGREIEVKRVKPVGCFIQRIK